MRERELNRLRRKAWLKRKQWQFTFTVELATSTKMLSPYDQAAWTLWSEQERREKGEYV